MMFPCNVLCVYESSGWEKIDCAVVSAHLCEAKECLFDTIEHVIPCFTSSSSIPHCFLIRHFCLSLCSSKFHHTKLHAREVGVLFICSFAMETNMLPQHCCYILFWLCWVNICSCVKHSTLMRGHNIYCMGKDTSHCYENSALFGSSLYIRTCISLTSSRAA